MRCEGERAVSKVFLARKEGQTGTFLRFLSRQPDPMSTLELVPEQASLFASVHLDLSTLTRELLANDGVRKLLFRNKKGATVESKTPEQAVDELTGALKDEVALYLGQPYDGGMLPEAAVVCVAKDPVALQQNFLALLKLARREQQPVSFMGGSIFWLANFPVGLNSPFAPCMATFKQYLAFSYAPQSLKALIRLSQEPKNLLRDSDDFKRALSEAGPERVGLLYLDNRQVVLWFYNTINPSLSNTLRQISEGGAGGFDARLLPSSESMARYFSVTAVSANWQGNSLSLHVTSDGFDPLSLAFHGAAFAPYWIPLAELKEREDVAEKCRVGLYMSEHPKEVTELPLTQQEFVSKFMLERGALVCPSDKKLEELPDGSLTSYEYFPEKYSVKMRIGPQSWRKAEIETDPLMVTRNTLILYDNKPRHLGGRNVMTTGGQKWMSEEEFQRVLKEQLARVRPG